MRSWNFWKSAFDFLTGVGSQFTNEELKLLSITKGNLGGLSSQFTNEELKRHTWSWSKIFCKSSQFTNEELKHYIHHRCLWFYGCSQFTNEELKPERKEKKKKIFYLFAIYQWGVETLIFVPAINFLKSRSQFTNEELKQKFHNLIVSLYTYVRNLPMRSWN